MEGDFTNSRSGKKSHARSGTIVKSSEGILNIEGGSRFDILNKEMDVSMNEGIATGGNPNEGKLQAQKANDQETIIKRHDGASVLHQFHKEITEFEANSSKMDDGCLMQDNLSKQNVSNFDVMASDLEEAMAVVSE
ncbi:hypothetical protein LWI28_023285 [Acer negundo]|uniref:Uncharacterized protein n=1 Tax=Acer negundo TaxID=4023 RepID=A0AAD5NTX4_ACENE|nr:hypothetical protein LWI28_023285 [Acer negundo]